MVGNGDFWTIQRNGSFQSRESLNLLSAFVRIHGIGFWQALKILHLLRWFFLDFWWLEGREENWSRAASTTQIYLNNILLQYLGYLWISKWYLLVGDCWINLVSIFLLGPSEVSRLQKRDWNPTFSGCSEFHHFWKLILKLSSFPCKSTTILKDDASFWMMINPYLKKMVGNRNPQPDSKNGGISLVGDPTPWGWHLGGPRGRSPQGWLAGMMDVSNRVFV